MSSEQLVTTPGLLSPLVAKGIKTGLAGLFAVFAAFYVYFWNKRRKMWAKVVQGCVSNMKKYTEVEREHTDVRVNTRHPCNILGLVENFRDIVSSDPVDSAAKSSRVRTPDMRRFNNGLVFRSSNPNILTKTAVDMNKIVKDHKIEKVIDLRDPYMRRGDKPDFHELVGKKNVMGVSMLPLNKVFVLASPLLQVKMLVLWALRVHKQNGANQMGIEQVKKFFNDTGIRGQYLLALEYNKGAIFQVLKVLTQEKSTVLIHDDMGKDAVGLISLLLLLACEARPEDVVKNYAMSSSLLSPAFIADAKSRAPSGFPESFFDASPPEAALFVVDWLTEHYGSAEGYLDDIGFDANMRKVLQKKFVPEADD